MSIKFATVQAPTSYFHPDTIGMIINADLTVYVNNEIAALIRVVNTEGAITITLESGNLKIQVQTLYIYDATLTQSEIGDLPLWQMRTFFNFFVKTIFIPVVNI
jgi:hypothetical protein